MTYTPSTRIENTSQLLGRSLSLYCSTFKKVFFLSLILSIIAFIPRIIALILKRDVIAELPILSPHQLWILLIYIVDLTLFISILWRLQCVTSGAHESLADDVLTGLRNVPLILFAALIQFLIFIFLTLSLMGLSVYVYQQNMLEQRNLIGFFIVGLPAVFQMLVSVYIFYLFYFYYPIILTESRGAFAALGRSAKLVWGRWWSVFWPITLPWIIYLLVLIGFKGLGFPMHIYFFEAHALTLSATLIHIVTFAVFIPWFAATALVVLRNLEIRFQPKKPRPKAKIGSLTSL